MPVEFSLRVNKSEFRPEILGPNVEFKRLLCHVKELNEINIVSAPEGTILSVTQV